MWWWWLSCGAALEVTGPTGMVARVTDHEGAPVVGLRVASVEAEDETDAEGRFAVPFKAPQQHVRFKWRDVAVERTYAAADDGRVLALALPATREVSIVCPAEPCALTATWALPEGFRGTYRALCDGSSRVAVVPVGAATLSCTVGKGAAERPLVGSVVDDGSSLGIR
jgi:hypothetical protein